MHTRALLAGAVVALVAALCLHVPQTFAQYGLRGAETALTIALTPENPAPGETVTLLLQSPVYDLAGSDIIWTSGEETLAAGIGKVSIDVIAGALGEERLVTAEIISGELRASTTAGVAPTRVDLLWEADTYTPPFYRGRALPSAGSRLRLFAVPYFPRTSGASPSETALYEWKRNGETIGRGVGKSSITVAAPVLYGSDTFTVSVTSADGRARGSARARIAAREPALMLYQDHPLYGIMYHRALAAQALIESSEASFIAVPLFAAVESPAQAGLAYEWTLNGKGVPAQEGERNALTINARNSDGIARVRLGLTGASNVFLDAAASWTITFSDAESVFSAPTGGAASQ